MYILVLASSQLDTKKFGGCDEINCIETESSVLFVCQSSWRLREDGDSGGWFCRQPLCLFEKLSLVLRESDADVSAASNKAPIPVN